MRTCPRRLSVLAAILLALAGSSCAAPMLLRFVAASVIVDESANGCDVVLLLNGDGRFDRAASMLRRDPKKQVLLIHGRPRLYARIGAEPSQEEISKEALKKRGVADERVTVIGQSARNEWEDARFVALWMRQHPDARVVALTNQFDSRYRRYLFDRFLDDKQRQRIRVTSLRHRLYDETDWWRSRAGVKALYYAYLSWIYALVQGEPEPWPNWDPDEYERAGSWEHGGRGPGAGRGASARASESLPTAYRLTAYRADRRCGLPEDTADDTVLTVAVAESLLGGTGPLVDALHDYFHRYPQAGYGGSFIQWAKRRRRDPATHPAPFGGRP